MAYKRMDGADYVEMFGNLAAERTMWEQSWDEALRYTFPERGQFAYGKNTSRVDSNFMITNSRDDRTRIYDTTAIDSARLLSAALQGGTVPANSKWVDLDYPGILPHEIPYEAQIHLTESSDVLHDLFRTSPNFYTEVSELMTDYSVVGIGGLYVELNDKNLLSCEFWSIGDLYLAEKLQSGVIDCVYRRCWYTPKQAIEKFGIEKLDEKMCDAYHDDPNCLQKFEFIHVIQPRMVSKTRQATGKNKLTKPFETKYICKQNSTVVYESGMDFFPLIIPRYTKLVNSVYALGAINDVMPDIKSINKLRELVLLTVEQQVSPPLNMKPDALMNNNTINLGPRAINKMMNVKNLEPLFLGGDLKAAEWTILQLQNQIRKVMFSDQLQPTSGPTMTATEIHVRTQLQRRQLGPLFTQLQTDFLTPLVKLVYNLAVDRGLIKSKPPEGDIDWVPVYNSPLARAQRAEELDSMARYEEELVKVAQFAPQTLDWYDTDKATIKKSKLLGAPPDVIRTQSEVDKIRRARQEAQAAAQQQEMIAASEQNK